MGEFQKFSIFYIVHCGYVMGGRGRGQWINQVYMSMCIFPYHCVYTLTHGHTQVLPAWTGSTVVEWNADREKKAPVSAKEGICRTSIMTEHKVNSAYSSTPVSVVGIGDAHL